MRRSSVIPRLLACSQWDRPIGPGYEATPETETEPGIFPLLFGAWRWSLSSSLGSRGDTEGRG